MKKIIFLLLFVFHLCNLSFSQSVGVGTTTPDNSAALDVQSTNKGMLVPRIALTSANAASPVTSPADALLIYNTASAGSGITAVAPGFYHWQSSISRWVAISSATTSNNTVGFGGWGDCSVQNISGYNPVVASDGAEDDYFGRSVAISGNYAIIGAPYDNNLNGTQNVGSAYIFFFNGVSWVQQQKIAASDGAADDQFGLAVSISGNYAVVGASMDDNGSNVDQGSAYIFFFNGSTWAQFQKLDHLSGSAGDQFGYSVNMKATKLIIGAPYDDIGGANSQGSADIYAYNGSSWVFQSRLVASDGGVADQFGFSVTVAGNYAFAGAPYDDIGSYTDQGSAYQFFYNGSSWVQQKKFTNTASTTANNRYGTSLSMSALFCVIGEPYSGTNSNTGAAFLYYFNSVQWLYHQYIAAIFPLAGNGSMYAGMSVSMTDDYFIVVAPYWSESIFNKEGKTFIYKNFSGIWQLYEDFVDPGGGRNEGFNLNAAIDNDRFVIGAPQAPLNVARGKAVFGKIE